MSYVVALAPDLGISAEEFAAAWNTDPESVTAARAEVQFEQGAKYVDPAITTAAIALVVSTVGGVVKDTLMELIKRKLAAIDTAKAAKVTAVESGPTIVLVVMRDDES